MSGVGKALGMMGALGDLRLMGLLGVLGLLRLMGVLGLMGLLRLLGALGKLRLMGLLGLLGKLRLWGALGLTGLRGERGLMLALFVPSLRRGGAVQPWQQQWSCWALGCCQGLSTAAGHHPTARERRQPLQPSGARRDDDAEACLPVPQ